jgi:HEAT repeat protein/beta-lactamase regulating signal transducer with metallopeptidase domain
MNGIESVASEGAVVSHVVLFALKVTLLLGIGFLASLSFRKASASSRHLLWTTTFVALLALPFAGGLGLVAKDLTIPIALLPAAPGSGASTVRTGDAPPVAMLVATRSAPPRDGRDAQLDRAPGKSNDLVSSTATAAVLVWAFGTALLFARLGAGIVASIREVLRAREVQDDAWDRLLDAACARLRLRGEVSLRASARTRLPMTIGLFHPTILLPESAASYAAPRRQAVLLHELAHVRRRDCLTLFLAQLVSAIYWWNPLVWLAARDMRLLSERASDDLVLATGTPPADYAHDLLEMARGLNEERFTPLASVAMAHRSRFEERLLAILDPGMARGVVGARWALGLGAFALPGLFFVALAVPTRASRPESTEVIAPLTTERAQEEARTEPGPREERVEKAPRPVAEPVASERAETAVVAETSQSAEREEPSSEKKPARERPSAEAMKKARAALAEALDDPDSSVQQQALHALVQMNDESVAPHLAHALESSDPETRAQAAWGLGQLRNEASAPTLSKALSDDNAEVREQAAWALGMIRSASAVDGLVGALADGEESVREQAAWALGMIRDPRAVEGLSRAVVDKKESVRSQAVWALGMVRAPETFDALATALSDENADVRSQAAWALGMLRDPRAIEPLSRALKDAESEVREQAAWALGVLANGGGDEPDPRPEPDPNPRPDPGFTPGKVL